MQRDETMKLLISTTLLALTGCAAPPPMTYVQSGNQAIYSQRDDLQKVRKEIEGRKKKLETAKLKEEIDQLTKEIADLNAHMIALEKRIADAEKAQATPAYTAPGSVSMWDLAAASTPFHPRAIKSTEKSELTRQFVHLVKTQFRYAPLTQHSY